MNRMTLIRVHMLLSTFMFPAVLMFLVTGGLYTWSIKGSYQSESLLIELAVPLQEDSQMLNSLVREELDQRDISYPSGQGEIKQGGLSYKYEWTGSRRDVLLEPTDDPLVAKLTVKEASWYRNLVQLHKAKGGDLFRGYAALLAVALFVILLSGFLVVWQIPKYRRQALMATLAGLLVFLLVVILS